MKKNLPTPIELMIYEFLTSEEFFFIIPHLPTFFRVDAKR